MPIHVYLCSGMCGQTLEFLTKTASAPVPPQIRQKCPRCQMQTAFNKTIGAPVVKTAHTTAVARRNDYHRKHPNMKENVVAGKTADGRVVNQRRGGSIERALSGGRRPDGAVTPSRVQDSNAQWGEAFSSNYGQTMTEARNNRSNLDE